MKAQINEHLYVLGGFAYYGAVLFGGQLFLEENGNPYLFGGQYCLGDKYKRKPLFLVKSETRAFLCRVQQNNWPLTLKVVVWYFKERGVVI